MAMPETSMNKDHFVPRKKAQIRRSRQSPFMQAKPVNHSMQEVTNDKFRRGAMIPYARHSLASSGSK